MILESLCVGHLQVNCYVLACQNNSLAVIIDPGEEEKKIRRVLDKHKLKAGLVINTHGHADHIGCDDVFGVTVYAHSREVALLKDPELNLSNFLGRSLSVKSTIKPVEEGEIIGLDGIRLEVIHVPGHSPGGICLLLKEPAGKILFSGDSLFHMSIGRTDFPGASEELLIKSIKEKLLKLSDDTIVYPGHGPASTIGAEKKNNPFLG